MTALKAWFAGRFARIVHSIAFWPSLFAFGFVLLAVLLRQFSVDAFARRIAEVAPFFLIEDRDVALSLLTTIIGGLISLMVFSFSMVMVLLSNATANLSPRLLPSLIGSRRHQVVLGIYLGTILFNLIVAMGYGLQTGKEEPPSVAVALAVLFGIGCLGLFVYFIHGVSQSIQVGVVLREAHTRTIRSIEQVLKTKAKLGDVAVPNTEHWQRLGAEHSDYLQSVDDEALAAFAKTHDLQLVMPVVRGKFYLEGDCVMLASHADGYELGELHAMTNTGSYGFTSEYFAHGPSRIVEVALKALSPGINDPGTALEAIDFLLNIFVAMLPLGQYEVLADKAGKPRVWLLLETWEELYVRHMTSLHTYGKSDLVVMARLRDVNQRIAARLEDHDAAKQVALRQVAKLLDVKAIA